MYRAWSAWCCASEENNRATSVGDFTSSLQAQGLEAVVTFVHAASGGATDGVGGLDRG
jgi:hypothetical protein